jgi:exodeoxyribonuclease V alpha subunit
MELSNGDTGLTLYDPSDGVLKVWFETEHGDARSLSPLRMPAHETAYAMTVHKSQGSEFQEVLLVLPEEPHPLVNRELIYTAVTRARQSVEIWATESTVLAGLAQHAQRNSGMAKALWSDNRSVE